MVDKCNRNLEAKETTSRSKGEDKEDPEEFKTLHVIRWSKVKVMGRSHKEKGTESEQQD